MATIKGDWSVIVSGKTWEPTHFRHYLANQVRYDGTQYARCGMVRGKPVKAVDLTIREVPALVRHLFKRKCVKCRVSEARDVRLIEQEKAEGLL